MSFFIIKKSKVGAWRTNVYLIIADDISVLIDPGDEPDLIDKELLKFNSVKKLDKIFATHGHFDHIGGVQFFKNKYNSLFFIHSNDRRLLRQANLYRKLTGDNCVFPIPLIDVELDSLTEIKCGSLLFKLHHLPGHSNGSMAFQIENVVFLGDILLENSLGRTDLPGGDKQQLIESIVYILDNFKDCKIFPGHGNEFILSNDKISFFKDLIKCM